MKKIITGKALKIIKKTDTRAGFSLIEVMVAIMILGVSFIGLIAAFPFALQLVTEAKNKTQAAYLAQEKIEEVNQLYYGDIATGTIEAKGPVGAPDSHTYSFQRETTVNYVDENLVGAASDHGLKKVSTTVYYIGAVIKTEKSYNITTVISRFD